MTSPLIRTELREGVLTIALASAHNGNLVDGGMAAAIVAAMKGIDEQTRVVVLRGDGADFCAGRVSPTPPPGAAVPSAEQLRLKVALPALELYDAIKAAPVPTLCAVQGRAHGVGAALAAVCDLVVAAENAEFQVPELDRDIPPTLVMSALADRVPPKTLAWLVLTRRPMTAREALASGLASSVVPAGALDALVGEIASTLAGTSAVALRACKQYLRFAPSMDPQAASAYAGHLAATALSARY
jgi:enoyl-CoA hydratase/carnithine racemase